MNHTHGSIRAPRLSLSSFEGGVQLGNGLGVPSREETLTRLGQVGSSTRAPTRPRTAAASASAAARLWSNSAPAPKKRAVLRWRLNRILIAR